MLGHQFHQHFVLALDLLFQKIDPLLLLLDLTAGNVLSSGRRKPRFRTTPSASDRTRRVEVRFPHTNRKLGLCLRGVASGWLLSLLRCSDCALFSYVLSIILTKERFFHFQLRQHIQPTATTAQTISDWENTGTTASTSHAAIATNIGQWRTKRLRCRKSITPALYAEFSPSSMTIVGNRLGVEKVHATGWSEPVSGRDLHRCSPAPSRRYCFINHGLRKVLLVQAGTPAPPLSQWPSMSCLLRERSYTQSRYPHTKERSPRSK